MKNHRRGEQQLHGQRRVIDEPQIGSARRRAQNEVHNAREQQQIDREPGPRLERLAPAIQSPDAFGWPQAMRGRTEDHEEKNDPAQPDGDGDKVEPERKRLKKSEWSHLGQ